MRNEVTMKKTLVLAFSLIAMAINLSACQKKPEEKLADALTQVSSDKEIQRLNEIGRQGDAAFDKLLGSKKSDSTESKKATKAPDSAAK